MEYFFAKILSCQIYHNSRDNILDLIENVFLIYYPDIGNILVLLREKLEDILVESYDNSSRQEAADVSLDSKSFKEVHGTLTEDQIKTETSRCLKCGCNIVDSNKCIGCGICTTKCEFDAIHLERDVPHASDMVVAEDKFKKILPYQFKQRVPQMLFKSDKAVAIVKSDADEHYFCKPEDYPRFTGDTDKV